jgi:hypothetical protein
MKAYRKSEKILPEEFEPVLGFFEGDDIGNICYYHDGKWFEAHTSEELQYITLWMPIPIKPNE